MGINDFIKYVKKAYRNERLGIYSRLNYAQNMEDSISTVAYDKIQRFYYDSNGIIFLYRFNIIFG